ncbi:MAG: hypothetical protein HOF98_06925 [Gammaproteobacteria bacterium]|jgi:hypothetical protein|nr:hypothetical protein [Gammaproteobacteria bacterium]MBT6757535.1 hypothetical protein [Candidatus Jacksonbacteria bacterium]
MSLDLDIKLPVEPAELLQRLPSECHWAVADSALLQSIALNEPVHRGKKGLQLLKIVQFFYKLKLVYLLLLVVGGVELIKLIRQQKKPSKQYQADASDIPKDSKYPTLFFFGFGAGSEELLFNEYCAENDKTVVRINQTMVESMGCWHHVGVFQSFLVLMRSLSLAKLAMESLPDEYSSRRLDFLTFIGMRIGYFSYVSTWFEMLKMQAGEIDEIVFLSPDTAAFAAVNTGLPTRFIQHGLIRRSLILPSFDRVDVLTHDEINHIRHRLPNADIRFTRPIVNSGVERNYGCVLVASIYGTADEMMLVNPFLEYAEKLGLSVHVRPHPCENHSFWKPENITFAVHIEDDDATLDAAIDRLKPSIVVSWYSTALADSLYKGVIPVSLSDKGDVAVKDMVYPLFSRCLHWPSEREDLQNIFFNKASYNSTLLRLKEGMDGACS